MVLRRGLVLDNTLFVHGGLRDENLGCVPGTSGTPGTGNTTQLDQVDASRLSLL